jgi:ParB family transcriptional regulator, chromosome partitioning protein
MARKGLGRGLASLIPSSDEVSPEPVKKEAPAVIEIPDVLEDQAKTEQGNHATFKVPVASIVPNELQPRKTFNDDTIKELSESIRDKGVLVPLIVSKKEEGGYELVSGERRLRASQILGLSEVPVVVVEAGPAQKLEIAIIENIQREDLNPIEEGLAYQTLMDEFGYTQEEVASKVGKDRTTVTNLLRLLKLSTKVKEALTSGKISMGHARALLGVREIEKQLYFVDRVAKEGWSVRELEKRLSQKRLIGARSRIKNLKPLSTHLIDIIDQLRRSLGTQVRVIPGSVKKEENFGSRGKIVIDYYSEDDLDRIYRTIVKN